MLYSRPLYVFARMYFVAAFQDDDRESIERRRPVSCQLTTDGPGNMLTVVDGRRGSARGFLLLEACTLI